MNNLSLLGYRTPRLVILILLVLISSGYLAWQNLPRQEDPIIGERFAQIITYMPGASAEIIDSLITKKLEEQVKSIEEVKKVEAVSRTNVSLLVVELHDSVRQQQTDDVWAQIEDELSVALPGLPSSASTPEIRVNSIAAHALILSLSVDKQVDNNESLRSRYTAFIQRRLLALPGVRDIDVFGRVQEEIRVDADVARLSQLNMTVADLAQAIATHQVRGSAGTSYFQGQKIDLELEDRTVTPDSVSQLTLPLAEGLTVGDVANVWLGLETPPSRISLHNSEEVVLIAVRPVAHQRVDRWTQIALADIEQLQQQLPDHVELNVIFNQSEYIDQRFDTLIGNLLLALMLVLPLLVILQGSRSAVLTATAVPVTMLGMLAVMQPTGVELHQMSVTGMIIALGIMIDNPIVVIDRLQHYFRKGMSTEEAIVETTTELRIPLLISSLTTGFAFAPIAASQSASGEFVGPMAFMVIVAVILSYIVSIFLLPAIAGHIFSRLKVVPSTPPISNRTIESVYTKLLTLIVRKPLLGILAAVIVPMIGMYVATKTPTQFFPPVDRDMFQIQVEVPAVYTVESTVKVVEKIDSSLQSYPWIEQRYWTIGGEAPRVFYNLISTGNDNAQIARGFIYTEGQQDARKHAFQLQRDLIELFPGIIVRVDPFTQGPPVFAPLEVKIWGNDSKQLRRLGQEVRKLMSEIDGITYSKDSFGSTQPRLELRPKGSEANSIRQWNTVPRELGAALDGIHAGSVLDAGLDIPIRVYLAGTEDYDAVSLLSLPLIKTPSGVQLLPITLVEPRTVPAPSGINTIDTRKANIVQAWLNPFVLAAPSEKALKQKLTSIEVPDGYEITFGGESEESAESIAALLGTAVFFFFLILTTLVLGLRSFGYAGLIFLVVVLASGLALLGIYLSGEPRGFIGVVGIIGLIGLAINDSVIVLSEIRRQIAIQGYSESVVVSTVFRSSRHVLATTLTTIASFIPLMTSIDTFWIPLAYAIAGGIAGATLIAVALIPAVVVLVERYKARRNSLLEPY